jgi:hypothetical protein
MSHVANETEPAKNPFISNKLYDQIKFLATIVFPALGTAYSGLAVIWGFPFGQEVVGTIVVIDTFLGAVLLITTARYNKSDAKFDGALLVDTSDPVKDSYLLEVNDLSNVSGKDQLTLKVTAPTPVQ